MFIFGLHSISDDQLSDLSDKCRLKCEKRAPKSSKMKCAFLDYVQFLMIDRVIRVMNVNQNVKKGPLSHQKMKCLFVDYFQFLMIGQMIQEMNINQNAKKGPPRSSKNEMFIFGLHSISDDWSNDLSDEH